MNRPSAPILNEAALALRSGDRERAVMLFREVLRTEPRNTHALIALAELSLASGRPREAIELYGRLPKQWQRKPAVKRNHSRALNDEGIAHMHGGDAEAASGSFDRAMAIDATNFEAAVNRARASMVLSRLDEAERFMMHARSLSPRDPSVDLLAARIELLRGNLEHAERLIEGTAPRCAVKTSWRSELADLYATMGRIDQARPIYENLIAEAEDPMPAIRWARILSDHSRPLEAVSQLDRATGHVSYKGGLDLLIADLHRRSGQAEQCRSFAEKVLERDPFNVTAALFKALVLPTVYADREHLLQARNGYEEGLRWIEESWLPRFLAESPKQPRIDDLAWQNFLLAYQGYNDLDLQLRFAAVLQAMIAHRRPDLLLAVEPSRDRRRRQIGLVSSFWNRSTVGSYFGSWISAFRDAGYQTHLIQIGDNVDPYTHSLANAADFFHLWPLPLTELAEKIRALGLDAVLFPEVGMDARTFTLAATRLAPIQGCAWGHPVTTGLQTMDTYFSCESMETARAASHYSERLVLLPGLGTCYERPEAPPTRTRAEIGLPEKARLYLVPQSTFKVHPLFDALLVGVLERDKDGRAVLFEGREEGTTAPLGSRLSSALSRARLDPRERLIFLRRMSREDFLEVNRLCDVMLDVPQWSGGNTSLDAIAAGLPIVTLPGELMRSRQAAGILSLLGLDELVAGTPDRYIQTAIAAASDADQHRELRRRIASSREVLFDNREPLSRLVAEWPFR